MSDYPEHEKLKMVHHESQKQGEFLEWLHHEKRLTLCHMNDHGDYEACYQSKESLLAEFHEIDLKKLSREKDAMVEAMRTAQRAEAT